MFQRDRNDPIIRQANLELTRDLLLMQAAVLAVHRGDRDAARALMESLMADLGAARDSLRYGAYLVRAASRAWQPDPPTQLGSRHEFQARPKQSRAARRGDEGAWSRSNPQPRERGHRERGR